MTRTPVQLPTLRTWVRQPEAVEALTAYFQPDREPEVMPHYEGSRFEGLAGGGDRPEVANQITADDLIALNCLSVRAPVEVALNLLEGPLGKDIAALLAQIPTDVHINDDAAAELFAPLAPARQAWDLLEEPDDMGWVTTNKLLARKRPKLIPVYDSVVQCVLGRPEGVWNWLRDLMMAEDGALPAALAEAAGQARVPGHVTPLRVLDVVLWMRHRPVHLRSRCPGPAA